MDLQQLLQRKRVLVSDGAWGTQFQKLGLEPGDAPELLNAERPDIVEQVACSYVEAGSDVILTNTFGGSPWKLEKAGLADRAPELNRLGVAMSKRAAGARALVLASIGPTGEFMQPLGLKTEKEFIDCFGQQIGACAEAGADGILIETMIDLDEATAALRAAREVCSLPLVVSMTFEPGAKGFATVMGVSPEQAAARLVEAGADVVGSNCGSGIDNMVKIAQQMGTATDKPLWIKSNAGVPELVDGQTVFRETPQYMADRVAELVAAGARFVGGCCGTTPEHIAAFVAAVRKL